MPGYWRKYVPETLPKTRYSFFKENGKLRAVIAAVEWDGNVYAAVAMCHADDQFNRTIGKRIAEGRVHKCMAFGVACRGEKAAILPVETFVQHLRVLRILEEQSTLSTLPGNAFVAASVVTKIIDIFGYE